ncbi:hypothetical protein SAMN05444338_10617 [Flavobacterium degerlachei]|uniref:Uncharacterized protein n=1 Tax=Flavobacterium degerlachei TaxID=229203 RepID=A0A1H2XUH4_9FLAO|nr:hypothetical protein SAMN05444338_10617 [Flavobacterium degerlachei]
MIEMEFQVYFEITQIRTPRFIYFANNIYNKK